MLGAVVSWRGDGCAVSPGLCAYGSWCETGAEKRLDLLRVGRGGVKKRLVAVVLTALSPALGMLVYNEVSARAERYAEVHRQVFETARQAASEVKSVVEGVKALLIATAVIPAVTGQDKQACTDVLKSVAARVTQVRNIVVLDRNGKLVCDNMGWEVGSDFSDRDYVRQALRSDALSVGEYTVSRISNAPIVPMALAIKQGSETVGVLATAVHLEWLEQRIVQRGLPPGGWITIADRNGIVLARNPGPEKFVGTQIPPPYHTLVQAQQPGTTERVGQDGIRRIMGYVPVSPDNPFYVSAGFSADQAFAPIDRASLLGLAMIAVGAGLALLAAFFIGNRFILGPITHIVAVLQRWRQGDLAARTGMTGRSSELGQVGATVDSLLDELEARRCEAARAEENRKLVARELAHRVKNTMAMIQAIARQTFKDRSQENGVFARRVAALAGAYDILLSEDWKSAGLRDVLERALQPFDSEGDRRIVLQGAPCTLPPEAAVALSLIAHELATNAVKYGSLRERDGRVKVEWRQEQDRIELQWREEDGPPVVDPTLQGSDPHGLKGPGVEGFGSRLIRSAFPRSLSPKISSDFRPDGLRFHLSFAVTQPGLGQSSVSGQSETAQSGALDKPQTLAALEA
ncbi:HAMP domain-containing protein [Agrobacterium vitis]|nr:HAMP domain-containing protein [Allorhizobium ampelinum]MUO89745.1 HAMP domain-containing protein [Agrobacterium vitis]MUZ51313.1 HAMP domain-containing protein [Agrobacterium vitis]MUZ92537.1 HAMP domain-containing protein [Agrobacterium vitis]MVA38306.1 HAMP domain-containing protein [Agrobacterium vitis]